MIMIIEFVVHWINELIRRGKWKVDGETDMAFFSFDGYEMGNGRW